MMPVIRLFDYNFSRPVFVNQEASFITVGCKTVSSFNSILLIKN